MLPFKKVNTVFIYIVFFRPKPTSSRNAQAVPLTLILRFFAVGAMIMPFYIVAITSLTH